MSDESDEPLGPTPDPAATNGRSYGPLDLITGAEADPPPPPPGPPAAERVARLARDVAVLEDELDYQRTRVVGALQKRVDELERAVEALRRQVDRLTTLPTNRAEESKVRGREMQAEFAEAERQREQERQEQQLAEAAARRAAWRQFQERHGPAWLELSSLPTHDKDEHWQRFGSPYVGLDWIAPGQAFSRREAEAWSDSRLRFLAADGASHSGEPAGGSPPHATREPPAAGSDYNLRLRRYALRELHARAAAEAEAAKGEATANDAALARFKEAEEKRRVLAADLAGVAAELERHPAQIARQQAAAAEQAAAERQAAARAEQQRRAAERRLAAVEEILSTK